MSFKEFFSESNQGLYRIFQDLDGCLVDFSGGFRKLTGQSPDDFEEQRGTDEFWKVVNKEGERFWTELSWTKDGRELWSYIKKYNPIILSSPSNNPECKTGKIKWVKKNLMIPENRIIISKNKKQYVKSDMDILIDDMEKNIGPWKNVGGIGILHINTSSTIKKLKELGL